MIEVIASTNECMCLPKAGLVDSLKKSASAYVEKRVDVMPSFFVSVFLDSP